MVAAVSAFAGHFSPCKSALRAQPGISLRHHHLRRRHQHPVASNVLPPQGVLHLELEAANEGPEIALQSVESLVISDDAGVEQRKPRIKLGEIMGGILNQRAVEARDLERPILDIRTGDVLEIKLQVPENKRRLAVYKGIVRIHTTIRIRRIIAGVGVEIVLPLKMRFTMSIAAPIAF